MLMMTQQLHDCSSLIFSAYSCFFSRDSLSTVVCKANFSLHALQTRQQYNTVQNLRKYCKARGQTYSRE